MVTLTRAALCAFVALTVAGSCTLTHPLDDLQSGFGRADAGDGGRGGSVADGGSGNAGQMMDGRRPDDGPPPAWPPHCRNGRRDSSETAIDCGGACGACIGARCDGNDACASGVCLNRTCGCPAGMSRNLHPTDGSVHCIDDIEVTNQAYALFLSACDAAGQCKDAQHPTACDGNSSFRPSYPLDTYVRGTCADRPFTADGAAAALPVVCVDWCDAYAFCKHAGKRLCGSWSEEPTPYNEWNDTGASEWFNACTAGSPQRHPYPYGATAVDQACVGTPVNAAARTAPEPGGSFPECHGPGDYAAVYDMVGNVREWENSCSADPADDSCRVRGNGFDRYATELACSTQMDPPRERLAKDPTLGFRCCAF